MAPIASLLTVAIHARNHPIIQESADKPAAYEGTMTASRLLITSILILSSVVIVLAADPSQTVIAKRDQINARIEDGLRANSSAVYRLFGMDKIMRQLHLSNVKGGESAYCFLPSSHAPIPAGCYVEFYIMQNNRNYPGIWYKNDLCGALVRWYAPWDDLNHYRPNSAMAHLIADRNVVTIPGILDDNWRMCQSSN